MASLQAPENSSNLNEWKATLRKKIENNGLFDTALLITNADQLRHALNVENEKTRITLTFLVGFSIFLQLTCVALLIWDSFDFGECLSYCVRHETRGCVLEIWHCHHGWDKFIAANDHCSFAGFGS